MDRKLKSKLMSDNGFPATLWGPCLWTVIHCACLNYPKVPGAFHRDTYHNFFLGLAGVLPCGECRDNFMRHMLSKKHGLQRRMLEQRRDEPEGSARRRMFEWSVRLHNAVNMEIAAKHPERRMKKLREAGLPMKHWYATYLAKRTASSA